MNKGKLQIIISFVIIVIVKKIKGDIGKMCIQKVEPELKIETYQQWEDHMIVMRDIKRLRAREIKLIKKILG